MDALALSSLSRPAAAAAAHAPRLARRCIVPGPLLHPSLGGTRATQLVTTRASSRPVVSLAGKKNAADFSVRRQLRSIGDPSDRLDWERGGLCVISPCPFIWTG